MRTDLAQLDAEALALLTNRGLTKRAAKMIDKGQGPELAEDANGTVVATFPDGILTTWPVDTKLVDAACTCGSTKACRHRVATALAYDRHTDDDEEGPWDPGAFTDVELEALVGARALTTARSRVSRGVEAEVVRGEQPRVHLANGTVRFPVRGALAMAHCDTVGAERGVMIALAVWAFREAGEGPEPSVQLVLGEADGIAMGAAEIVEEAVRTVLSTGVADLPRTAAGELSRATEAARTSGWTWVVDGLEDLAELIGAWQARSQRYSTERAAWVLAELVARIRAARAGAPPSPGWFLGRGVAPEAALDHLTLVGLGATVRPADDKVEVDVYFLDVAAGATLVLRRRVDASGSPGRRRAGGSRLRLGELAGGVLTTQGAYRRANRLMRLGSERGGRMHDLKTSGAQRWGELPLTLTAQDTVRARLTHRPPRFLRPRLLAEDMAIVAVGEVRGVHWEPGAQRLVAQLALPDDSVAVVVLEHEPHTPGACAALEAALHAEPRHIAGRVHLEGETMVVTPTAVATEGGLVIPAFADDTAVRAAGGAHAPTEPVRAALHLARSRLAECAHRGLDAAPSTERAARSLAAVGLGTIAGRVARAGDGPEAWVDAWLSVVTAIELP